MRQRLDQRPLAIDAGPSLAKPIEDAMPHPLKSLTLGAALAVLALPAAADITPEQLWENWQALFAAGGQTVVAESVERQGDDLVISNLTIAAADQGETIEGSLEQLVMTDLGNGTVGVTWSADFPMRIRFDPAQAEGQAPPGARPMVLDMLYHSPEMVTIASGNLDDIRYDMTAPKMQFTLQEAAETADPNVSFVFDITMTDTSGSYVMKAVDQGMNTDFDLTMANLAIAVDGIDKTKGSDLRMVSTLADMSLKSQGLVLPAAGAGAMPADELAKMNMVLDIAYGSGSADLDGTDANGPVSIRSTTGAATGQISIQNGAFGYDLAQSMVTMAISGAALPVPELSMTMDAANMGLSLPIAPSDTAKPFGFSISLQNLALSDAIWSLFDPSAQLPRDPIQFELDTAGMVRVPAQAPAADAPAAALTGLDSLNLKNLRLALAGADLRGSGTSTFAPDATGQMQPDAKLDFTLNGANGLMDKLVAAGLATPDMLSMPRMMLAMVARQAADGADSYASQIEVRDKSVFANGQMLYQFP
jgi:hypothetical protein